MPISDPASIQHVLQMSPAVERVMLEAQTHHRVDNLRKEERAELDEIEQSEIQDPEETNESNSTDPDGKNSNRQIRVKKKKASAETEDEDSEPRLPIVEGNPSAHLDFRV